MAFQFKIQLNGVSKPPVTREVVVNENISFHRFHEIIQIAMVLILIFKRIRLTQVLNLHRLVT